MNKKQKNENDYNQQLKEITLQPIVKEMQQSYLSYAMTVIVSRALPDVRDGLKPVHRRILYSMWKTGLKPSAKFRKSATVIGEVLGKYHPHGDTAVYDSMVRMAQEWSLRYPLVWGQGNFGSMDGDSAAAYRYTEAKLKPIAQEMLFDIEKETVDFKPNFDGVHQEPVVLPAKLPQLLLNGAMGIAVGMATNIPPHNLNELVGAIVHLIDNPSASIDDLMEFVKGPDFPTGGIIYNKDDIKEGYATGRGKVVTRARAGISEGKAGQFSIIITEMTYLTNKATLVEKIASLHRDKKIIGIKALRDESSKGGVRIVIDLKKDAYPQKVLNRLYTLTDLQKNFNMNMLALVNGVEPRILNLKEILEYYIIHRRDVVRRRTQFELNKAEARAHILEGLKKALDHIDEVIKIIRASKTKEIASDNLIKKFNFSKIQTQAILEMRLQTLAGLERKKIEDELAEMIRLIKKLKEILASEVKMKNIIKKELLEILEKFGDVRKTKVIEGGITEFKQEDLIAKEDVIITMTSEGYIKRILASEYKTQRRGGKGVIGTTTKDTEILKHILSVSTHDELFFFTDAGKVYRTKAYEIPEGSRIAKGNAIVNFLQLAQNESITKIIPINLNDTSFKYLFMVTREGVVKKVDIQDFGNVRRSGLIAINLKKNDKLKWVLPTTGEDDIVLVTSKGMAIRFNEKNVRSMGRAASGVRGVKLGANDFVVGADISAKEQKGAQLLVITENGFGKRTPLADYKIQNRGGVGVKTAKVTSKIGSIVSAYIVGIDDKEKDLLMISVKGQIIRIRIQEISKLGRATQGVRVMRPKVGDKVSGVTII